MMPVASEESDDLRVNLLTQEIKFAKLLAGNEFDGGIKEKHLDKLSAWLKSRTACTEAFTDKDCLRIWKGLFYSMWMSDKPLPQESLANKIANLLHTFDRIDVSLQFFAAFLKTMANEWNGIDQWRIDKFMMLVRKMTREMLRVIQNQNWSDESIQLLDETLTKTVLGTDHVPRGLFMHFTELFFEEVAKVSNGDIETDMVTKLLQPFMFYVASQGDYKLIQYVVRHVFNHLLFQSESGREYKEKFDAWKSMNFPGTSINDLVLDQPEESDDEQNGVENDGNDEDGVDEESEENQEQNGENAALDPRAGRVDVMMAELQFDPLGIVKKLEDLKYKKFTRVRNRKCIDRIVTTYTKFAGGVFPIGIQKLKVKRDGLELPDVDEKVNELVEFENDLYGKTRELKKMTKRKRKKIVSDEKLYDEFQAKSNKIAKIKTEANAWTEEDISEESMDQSAKKVKKYKKTLPDAPADSPKTEKPKTATPKAEKLKTDTPKAGTPKAEKQKAETPKTATPKAEKLKVETPKIATPKAEKPKSETAKAATPKSGKKHKASEWDKPLEDGEMEYFVPAKKHQVNGVTWVTTTKDGVVSRQITPSKDQKAKVNGTEAKDSPLKTPGKKSELEQEATVKTPIKNADPKFSTPKSTEKKVKLTSKLAQSKTSTPNIFVDRGTPSSAEKRVKIELKMNRSQEVTEYMRQLKQSPHLPYDSAKKPSKGVLKPNLAPSPINPFYKRLIGIE